MGFSGVLFGGRLGQIVLMYASWKGYAGIVEMLLNKGVDANIKYKKWAQGFLKAGTALMVASKKGYPDIVEILLNKGADVNAKNKWGETSLILAIVYRHSSVIRVLLNKGADVNAYLFESPLMLACVQEAFGLAMDLVYKGADVNATSKDKLSEGFTPLMWASDKKAGNLAIVGLLLEAGAEVNARSNNGWTALLLASNNGRFDIVKILLAKGADVTARDNSGNIALRLAKRHPNVIELLKGHGAC